MISTDHFGNAVEQSVLAMVTSARRARWPSDTEISGLAAAGLGHPSLVRLKLFTLDHRLILRRLGTLNGSDQATVAVRLREVLGL
ncbi:MAG: hypothetical protein Kow00122_07490 [Thermoleophilia bacterium]